jgi:GxxExxY protein
MKGLEFINAEDAEQAQSSQSGDLMENHLSHEIIGAAIEVQRELGVGLLENAYTTALGIELAQRGLCFQKEVPIPGVYKGKPLGLAYRADLIVERTVIVEVKAVDAVAGFHRAQVLSYLRLTGLKLGLLINFHVAPLMKGVHRVVNKL